MKLSIVIPVYNEEKTIKKCIERVKKIKLGAKIKKEIIVVNDGSTDKTRSIINNLASSAGRQQSIIKISYKRNKGKGFAIRQGLKKATGDYIIIQDADLEYDPKDYQKLLDPILDKKAQVVYGSRFLGPHKNLFFLNMLANKFLSLLTNILYNTTLTDMEVGYKLFSKPLLDSLNLRENGFGFEPEITAKILKQKIRIYEVPISYDGREYSQGKKITWQDGFEAVFILFKYRIFN